MKNNQSIKKSSKKNIRIIPRLDIKGPNVVKGINLEGLRVVGDPVELAYKYYNDGADEILYLDIVASLYQRNFDFDLLKSVSKKIFVPTTVGGGIRSLNDITNALRAGADKIAINTYAVHHPEFIAEAVHKFGSQCIALSVEAKKTNDGHWETYTDGGREKTDIDSIEWIKKSISLGVGEIIITSIDQDGAKRGFNLELTNKVIAISPVPVIVCGGAGSLDSVKKMVETCHPEAISAASVFHYRDYSISDLKRYLKQNGYNVRL
ncbi:MAG: hypothetical protein UT84_C0013G0013 [Candidatus Curtissbacteria bacterium GW2011_GWA1_40_16]|uniref:imidazole glycerol-phosphate synthase n=1 Tax=Candidatus Curtissbacteria bacterium GW2011_GWA1_40_16 TaxID=1618405 RepID=A0A0G0RCY0_9BACT|nr:MAG: hypothetical protein UT84_C0013G0013 [Candidatus Curtissbacteria bacterium GW2011_GWA1_40_16]